MKESLSKILVNNSSEIATEWEEKIKRMLPQNEKKKANMLVQQLMAVLDIYLIDSELETAANHCKKTQSELFPNSDKALSFFVNSLLVSRYILLSTIAKKSKKPINSLETFGYINDTFDPLIKAIYNTFNETPQDDIDRLPTNLSHAVETGLLKIDFVGIGVFVIDKNHTIIYWSNGMNKFFPETSIDVLGKNLLSHFPIFRQEHTIYNALVKALNDGKDTEIYAKQHKFSNSSPLYVNIKVSPLKDQKDNVIGASVFMHDITAHRKNEQALKRYEQYFENILNDAADAIMILNEDDKIVMWNQAAEILYGWPQNEVVGKTISFIVPNDPQAQEQIKKINRAVREKGFVRNFRTHRLTREGKKIVIEVTRTAIKNDQDQYIGSSVIARDISQEEQLRQQLIQSEKLSAVGTLAAGIAHEVGSPLTSISSITQILKVKSDDEYFKEKLSLIQQSIDRIARTVKTLVDFSRPITQKVEKVYLNNVIEHVIHIIKYEKRLKYHSIETEFEPDIPLVEASFDQLLQVFINICLNAADAMEKQKNGLLYIKTWYDSENIYAAITDNGRGIPAENVDHIFEPFFTTKKEGKGTGLGLWVSYNIMKSFSGDIKVKSVLDNGTTFTLSLPKKVSPKDL